MGELEQEYGQEAEFVVVPAEETKERQDEIDLYGFTEALHGLVIFDGQGQAQVKMPGHQFSREEIENALKVVLASGS